MAASRIVAHLPPHNHRQRRDHALLQPSPPDTGPLTSLKYYAKRYRNLGIRASLQGASDLSKKAHSIEFPDNDFPSDVFSKDLLALPLTNSMIFPSVSRGRLSSTQSSGSVSDGSRLRVAYQGVRGAYSESAARKAYPNCEAVPCEQFDAAFEAVERWLVNRAVLPFENSLGGSHRNYDLLLRHRLHIVEAVKYAVPHCLLANQWC